jgi:hypothetical protein
MDFRFFEIGVNVSYSGSFFVSHYNFLQGVEK